MKNRATHSTRPTAAAAADPDAPGRAAAGRARSPRRPARLLAAVTVPALLLTGCSGSDDGGDDDKSDGASESSAASPAPVKFKSLPDPCKAIAGKTVKDVVPGVDKETGKKLKTADQDRYNSCLWTGLDDYDYRSLTVSFHRFESESGGASGDKRAREQAAQLQDSVSANGSNKAIKESRLDGVGDKATGISYDTEKKDGKKSEDYREHRIVVLSSNVVLTVDYSAAGFEGAKRPSADTVRKDAEKVAKEALSAVK